VNLSVEIKHTLQDWMYLAAARGLNARLVTGDRPFQERAVPFYKHISLLPGCEAN
jgi:predicted nucleic acid-binding protein